MDSSKFLICTKMLKKSQLTLPKLKIPLAPQSTQVIFFCSQITQVGCSCIQMNFQPTPVIFFELK